MRQCSKAIRYVLLVVVLSLACTAQVAAYDPTVLQAQKRLAELGYAPGPHDGRWGPQTAGAVRAFQRNVGLPVTGALDASTTAQLGVPTTPTRLLFYYSPSCIHCARQQPRIRAFAERHADMEVLWRQVGTLNLDEQWLIAETSGHPVMVFFEGRHMKRIVGETSVSELEEHLGRFRREVAQAVPRGRPASSTVGSRQVCYY